MRQLIYLAFLIFALSTSSMSYANPKIQENNKLESTEQHLTEKRVKQHRWQTGYVLPQHYRSDAYKIDHRKDPQLSKPQRHQQWYRIHQEDILVDTENHQIIKIERK